MSIHGLMLVLALNTESGVLGVVNEALPPSNVSLTSSRTALQVPTLGTAKWILD